MADSLADKLRNRISVIDQAVDEGSTGKKKPNKKPNKPKEPSKKKPTKKPPKAAGVGKPSFDLEAAFKDINAQIAANPRLREKLEARKKAMRANQ